MMILTKISTTKKLLLINRQSQVKLYSIHNEEIRVEEFNTDKEYQGWENNEKLTWKFLCKRMMKQALQNKRVVNEEELEQQMARNCWVS